ncbi:MAG: hypothetical protein KAU95_00815 [Candidatus Aenigmarchaeota archaeon]|nr:hypothetical protein [Candidatus Aenigmarchaeota archaeon]
MEQNNKAENTDKSMDKEYSFNELWPSMMNNFGTMKEIAGYTGAESKVKDVEGQLKTLEMQIERDFSEVDRKDIAYYEIEMGLMQIPLFFQGYNPERDGPAQKKKFTIEGEDFPMVRESSTPDTLNDYRMWSHEQKYARDVIMKKLENTARGFLEDFEGFDENLLKEMTNKEKIMDQSPTYREMEKDIEYGKLAENMATDEESKKSIEKELEQAKKYTNQTNEWLYWVGKILLDKYLGPKEEINDYVKYFEIEIGIEKNEDGTELTLEEVMAKIAISGNQLDNHRRIVKHLGKLYVDYTDILKAIDDYPSYVKTQVGYRVDNFRKLIGEYEAEGLKESESSDNALSAQEVKDLAEHRRFKLNKWTEDFYEEMGNGFSGISDAMLEERIKSKKDFEAYIGESEGM